MEFIIEKINNDLSFRNKGIQSRFVAECSLGKIELFYKYLGEPNNGRVQLELEFFINNVNVLDKYAIQNHVELPYQYPSNFEIIDPTENYIAIPHTQGIIVLNVRENKKQLVSYQSHRYAYSYFLENNLVLVASKALIISSLIKKEKKRIILESPERQFISGVQVRKDDILLIARKVDLNETHLLAYCKSNLELLKKINLSPYILDKELDTHLDLTRETRLSKIPEFRLPDTISSWRYVPSIEKNALIGRITKYHTPIASGSHYKRVENYGIIKINVKESAC